MHARLSPVAPPLRPLPTPLLLLLLLLLLLPATLEAKGAPGWLAGLGAPLGSLLEDCGPARPGLAECARRRAWRAFDAALEDDVVPLARGLELVRLRRGEEAGGRVESVNGTAAGRKWSRRTGRATGTGTTTELEKAEEEEEEEQQQQRPPGNVSWPSRLGERLRRLLRTHVLKVDVDRLLQEAPTGGPADGTIEPRGRRRRRRQMQMMPIVMMGVLLMGTILIPMGFQFLAVLGGKALILAKMALMLSSIQGLKKVATSGVNYGLYHSPVVPEPWQERSDASAAAAAAAVAGFEVPYGGGPSRHLGHLGAHLGGRSAATRPT